MFRLSEIRTCFRDTSRVDFSFFFFSLFFRLSRLNDRRLNSVKRKLKHDESDAENERDEATHGESRRRIPKLKVNVFTSKCFLSIELCLRSQFWRMNMKSCSRRSSEFSVDWSVCDFKRCQCFAAVAAANANNKTEAQQRRIKKKSARVKSIGNLSFATSRKRVAVVRDFSKAKRLNCLKKNSLSG